MYLFNCVWRFGGSWNNSTFFLRIQSVRKHAAASFSPRPASDGAFYRRYTSVSGANRVIVGELFQLPRSISFSSHVNLFQSNLIASRRKKKELRSRDFGGFAGKFSFFTFAPPSPLLGEGNRAFVTAARRSVEKARTTDSRAFQTTINLSRKPRTRSESIFALRSKIKICSRDRSLSGSLSSIHNCDKRFSIIVIYIPRVHLYVRVFLRVRVCTCV